MEERRQYIRLNESLEIKYKVISPPDGHGNTSTLDISEGGISLPLDQGLLPGIILEIHIKFIESTEPIDMTGEVVWVKDGPAGEFPYVIGIKFINVNLRDRDRLYYYIHRKISKESGPNISWIE